MAQVTLVGPLGTAVRRVGMHAPKRPELVENWAKQACKTLKREYIQAECIRMDEDFIVFAQHDNCMLSIDRRASALGINN